MAAMAVAAAATPDGGVHAAIARELLAGSTEGRQALIGSCWFGPLPTIALLPFTWLLGAGELALRAAAWCYWTLALILAGRMTRHPRPRLILQGMLLAAGLIDGRLADPVAAYIAVLLAQGLRSAAGWCALQRTKDLVMLAFSMALLAGCGLSLAGVVLVMALCVPAGAWAAPATRRRLPAILVLGWMPLGYALGVWVLANWLIFGDPFFFVASLSGRFAPAWQAFRWSRKTPAEILGVLACLAALAGAAVRRAPAAVTPALIGLLAWVSVHILRALGLAWSVPLPLPAVALGGGMALWLSRRNADEPRPRWNAWGDLLIFLVIAYLAAQQPQPAPAEDRAMQAFLRAEVETFVASRTPHGRTFVCGYEGLRLLDGYTGDRMAPNLDLHIQELRRRYFGQRLFLLVHRPFDAAAMDDLHRRQPWLYESGDLDGRALHAGDFGVWRLFEIIGAPTEEELNAWRARMPE
jgi:hypothetical protein